MPSVEKCSEILQHTYSDKVKQLNVFLKKIAFFLNSEHFTSEFCLVLPCLRHVRRNSFDSIFINKSLLSKFDIALQHHYKRNTTVTYVPFVTGNEFVALFVANQPKIFRTGAISGDIISSHVPRYAKGTDCRNSQNC